LIAPASNLRVKANGTPASPLTHAKHVLPGNGGSKRCIWCKIHIGINEETLEMRAVDATTSNVGDAPMVLELLNQVLPD
jgi:hypothetical protein